MKRSVDDEVEENGVALDLTENTGPEEPTKKKQKSKQSDTSHDFSSKEIARLQETEAVFHSSLFRLQITELLKEVSLKQKLRRRIQDAVDTVSKLVESLPSGKEHKIADRKWLEKSGIKVPVTEKPMFVKGTFQFEPPSSIKPVGSFALNTVVKPNVGASLLLYIPKSCFDPKDYLNYRCIRKQALYLSYIAARLSKKKTIENLQFSYQFGNPLKPVLVVTVKGEESKGVKIELRAVPESGTFKLSRFQADKNNIRPKWYLEKSGEEEADACLPATPFYNMSMAYDLCTQENNELMERLLAGSEGVRQGIMLLTVWLKQRELLEGWGSFSSDLMTLYVCSLILKKKVNKQMNSYQVFRTTLLFLSRADWAEDPPSLKEDDEESPSLECFTSKFPHVFLDRTGHVNHAYMISASVFSRIKEEAKISISAFEHCSQQSFDVLFMTAASFPRTFDYIFHVSLSSALLTTAMSAVPDLLLASMDVGGHLSIALQGHIEKILTKALEDRVTLVQSQPRKPELWSVTDDTPNYDNKHLTFGIRLNPSGAFTALNKGPTADAPEAKEFRDFWGDKSEMRRFKDGTIHEAVLWTSSSLQCERRLVCRKIVKYVLNRHCGIDKSCVNYVGAELENVLQGCGKGTGEELSLDALKAFEDVSRAVRALSSLPLGIHSVQGSHSVFRHTDVFPAVPSSSKSYKGQVIRNQVVPVEGKSLPPYIPALTVVCMLEGSGKWPEDKAAIQCLKSLLHIKMGKELQDQHHLSVSISNSHVDVLKDGFVFRLQLANTREIAFLRTITTDSGMVKFRDTEEAVTLEKSTVNLPRLTHLLHGIQQENPSFSAAVRLCKRWIASQMFCSYITDEAVELIVAYIFISPHPYSSPSSPATGFLRFLHLLTTFNWKADPLMVNLNKEFTEEDLSTIPKEISKHRATLPSLCIVTPQDKSGTRWTKPQPSEPMLQRLLVIAKESLRILETQIMSVSTKEDFKLVFRPPYENFDLVIRLLKKVNVLRHQSVDCKEENTPVSTAVVGEDKAPVPVVEFNVCKNFFEDLKKCFGDIALFFYDPFGGEIIGMVWKQQSLQTKDFKISNFNYRKPSVDENEKFNLDVLKESILDDIRIMGGGIVESIQSFNEK